MQCGSGQHHTRFTRKRRADINEDRIKGNWTQFKGKVKEQWGKLTDDDMDVIAGKRDQMLGKLQERHGLAKEAAEDQLRNWERANPDFRWD